jgi:alkylglycerol monooxygenase
MNYVEVAVPFFILAMAVEFLYGKFIGKQTYRLNDTINSLQLGVLSRLNDLLKLGFASIVFGAAAKWLGLPQWSMNSAWQWVAAFVAYDFCYYWKHRFGHEWRILWASHVAHHQSEEFNLSTALRQTGTDYLGFVFYIPLFLAGVPAAVVVTVGSLNLIYQFWVHTEHIRRLGPLEWILITPSNHRVHHARNPEYIDRNYGGVFILWDRMFGTYKDEMPEVPCEYGITHGLKSWNPLWANFHFWWQTAQISWRTRRWRDKVRVWFMRPGWFPADLEAEATARCAAKPAPGKFDPPMSMYSKTYVFVQFWLLTAGSLWLLAASESLPRSFVLVSFFWFCASLYVQGVWLEARRQGQILEWVRLGVTLTLALIGHQLWPRLESVLLLSIGIYAAVSAVTLLIERFSSSPALTSA